MRMERENSAAEQAFLQDLAASLPAERLRLGQEALQPYECDGLSVLRELPLCVVLPQDRDEVQTVLRLCQEHQICSRRVQKTDDSQRHIRIRNDLRYSTWRTMIPLQRIARGAPTLQIAPASGCVVIVAFRIEGHELVTIKPTGCAQFQMLRVQ